MSDDPCTSSAPVYFIAALDDVTDFQLRADIIQFLWSRGVTSQVFCHDVVFGEEAALARRCGCYMGEEEEHRECSMCARASPEVSETAENGAAYEVLPPQCGAPPTSSPPASSIRPTNTTQHPATPTNPEQIDVSTWTRLPASTTAANASRNNVSRDKLDTIKNKTRTATAPYLTVREALRNQVWRELDTEKRAGTSGVFRPPTSAPPADTTAPSPTAPVPAPTCAPASHSRHQTPSPVSAASSRASHPSASHPPFKKRKKDSCSWESVRSMLRAIRDDYARRAVREQQLMDETALSRRLIDKELKSRANELRRAARARKRMEKDKEVGERLTEPRYKRKEEEGVRAGEETDKAVSRRLTKKELKMKRDNERRRAARARKRMEREKEKQKLSTAHSQPLYKRRDEERKREEDKEISAVELGCCVGVKAEPDVWELSVKEEK